MRTVIFLGLIYIGDSINTEQVTSDALTTMFSIILGIAMVFDVGEFFKKMTK